MQLSRNFSLEELIKSRIALKAGIRNQPNEEQIENLHSLCLYVLQEIRNYFKRPVVINSGFRCRKLNEIIGGSPTSQHTMGQAADIEAVSVDNKALFDYIRNELDFDQVILEYYQEVDPHSGWVHVSYNKEKNRKQALKAYKKDGKTRYEEV